MSLLEHTPRYGVQAMPALERFDLIAVRLRNPRVELHNATLVVLVALMIARCEAEAVPTSVRLGETRVRVLAGGSVTVVRPHTWLLACRRCTEGCLEAPSSWLDHRGGACGHVQRGGEVAGACAGARRSCAAALRAHVIVSAANHCEWRPRSFCRRALYRLRAL